MDNIYLCHHGVQGMKWGRRKTTAESVRAKYNKIMDRSSRYKLKSDKYRYKAGKQTQLTDFGVAKYNRLAKKSDAYYYRASRAANRGRKYIKRMERKYPELFDTKLADLITYDQALRDRV